MNQVRLEHRVLISGPEAHVLKAPEQKITSPIVNVTFPAVMRQSAIGFERQTSFDDEIHPTNLGQSHLQLEIQTGIDDDHSENGFLPGLGPAVDTLTQVLNPVRRRVE